MWKFQEIRQQLKLEDEPLVALDIVAALEGASADVGTAGTVKASDHTTLLDAALLDASLWAPVDEIAAVGPLRK